jgi:hypothetical protein
MNEPTPDRNNSHHPYDANNSRATSYVPKRIMRQWGILAEMVKAFLVAGEYRGKFPR